MKDLLNYYYYIITDQIRMQNRNYYFNYQNNYFCFYRYLGNIDDIYSILNLNNYMIYNNFKINKIILNKDGSIITTKDGNNYILILLTINSKNKINLKNILDFSRKNININLLNRNNWILLWSNKIDNIEYTRIHLKNKYKLIYNSLPYYIGLTENAISYLRYNNIKNDNLGICHKRVDVNDSLIDFYNPINLVIDYRVRDLAEYFKSAFFSKIMDVTNIINYLKKIKMSNVDYIYFYVRMLYPSYYFDIYDKVLNGILKEEEILSITKLQNDYEYLLYEIYLVIKSHVNIVGIEWINKKFAI